MSSNEDGVVRMSGESTVLSANGNNDYLRESRFSGT